MKDQQSLSSQAFSPQPQKLDLSGVGELSKKTWQIYKARLWTFLGITSVTVLGIIIWRFFLRTSGLSPFVVIADWGIILGLLWALIWILFTTLIALWPQIALLYAIKEREQRIGIREAFIKAWPRMIPYCWIFFLDGFVVMGGLMLLVIPGLIFAVWFLFAEYILIGEDKKGMNALFRSKQLVSGHWWSVFGRVLFMLFILVILVFPISFLTAKFKIPFVENIVVLLTSPLFTIFTFLVYEDLRRVKSGIPFQSPSTRKKIIFLLPGIIGGLLALVSLGLFLYGLMSLFK